jgi:hypothetical protein
MKLINTIRQAFVSAVMQDVPMVDHDELAQTAVRHHLRGLFEKQFPGIDFESSKAWLKTTYFYMPGALNSFNTQSPWDNCTAVTEVAPEIKPMLEELSARKRIQHVEREALHEKLTGIANACTTRKALVQALPEFEKYLPAEPVKDSNLPALANVVAEFVKAGWPKTAQEG